MSLQHSQFWNIDRLSRNKEEWPVGVIVVLLLCLKLVKDVFKASLAQGMSATQGCTVSDSPRDLWKMLSF